jgi:cell division protein FtsB
VRATYSVLTRRRVVAICAGLTAVYLAVLSGQRALDGYRARQEVVVAAHEIESLRVENLNLQTQLNTALSEAEIERLARNELGLVKPGDKPVVLIWPDSGPPATTLESGARSAPAPRWKVWLRLFFDTD